MKLTDEQLKRMAQHVAEFTYSHLCAITDIDRVTAKRIAASAANKYAQDVELSIRETGAMK